MFIVFQYLILIAIASVGRWLLENSPTGQCDIDNSDSSVSREIDILGILYDLEQLFVFPLSVSEDNFADNASQYFILNLKYYIIKF